MVDRKFVEAADALRFEMVNAHDGSFAPFVDRSLKDKIEAYDTARSRLAAAQPAEHPESIGGLASRTPASKQGKKALDEMLLVFAKHDDDEEDCWTQPARLGMQYVSDLEWDLETQVRLASHRAEANESLRIMLSNLAAYTGTHFGPDEPLKNYERVRKTLTDKPEPPAPSPQAQGEVCEGCGVEPARTYSADDVHLCVKCARENVDGSSLPAPEESAPLTDAEAQRLYDDAGATARPFGAHEVERFVRTTVDPASEILALQKQRNDVYEERDRLVAALSKCFPSWLARHPDADKEWDDQWRWIVFVQLPTGQATWHIQDRELPWFDHLARRTVNDWDGHTTEEKYRRLARLTAPAQDGEPSVEECLRVAHEAIKSKHPHTAALAAQLIDAAMRIDWKQVGLNGGGCFHLEEDGRFCLRAHYWAGHGGEKPTHMYEPLYVVMTRIAKASDAAPALAALVEAGDAMRAEFNHQRGDGLIEWNYEVIAAWDAARAALPKDGAS